MIRIEGLRKSFQDGDQVHAVIDGLDLEVEPGTFLALLGRSGSGKSTLLNCIAGIETPDAGKVILGDVEITALSDRDRTRLRRDRIGIVFQFFNLLPMMSVLDNVALPRLLAGGKRKETLERAQALLDELGLGDRASEMPDHLSGGEQQRVATARALINEPAVLLADEPTGNLDATTAEKTLELLQQVNEKHGVTVIMVTHSREAAKAAQKVALLVGGGIEWPVEPEPQPAVEESAEADAVVDDVLSESEGKQSAETGTPTAATDTAKASPAEPGAKTKVRPSAKAAALFGGGKKADEEPSDA